jgi:hypothetical protein
LGKVLRDFAWGLDILAAAISAGLSDYPKKIGQ